MNDQLQFPVFLIEDTPDNQYTGFRIVEAPSAFVAFSRMPIVHQFNTGKVFDSNGSIFVYENSDGWPRFSLSVATLLEFLIVPPLFFALLYRFIYFGPRLIEEECKLEFKSAIIDAVAKHNSNVAEQLSHAIDSVSSPSEVISGIDQFLLHGGERDPDGHPS